MTKLADLQAPPVDLTAALGGPTTTGVIGAILGESSAEAAKRLEEAKKSANDLTGIVRKKEKKPEPAAANSKRKAEEDGEGEAKKAKVDA